MAASDESSQFTTLLDRRAPPPATPVSPETLAARVDRALAVLKEAAATEGPVALASSLSAEDQVLTDLIVRHGLPIEIFTLETGRLHPETVEMIAVTQARYGVEVAVYRPEPSAVAAYVAAHGANAFYESVELRKACCGIRKVEPLGRALLGKAGWITGQRREQSFSRTALHETEQDQARGLRKFNPLADWTWAEVLAYVEANDVPINPLHKRGYPSIGCDPCTRAVRPWEDPRAGRWWWEEETKKECGLHVAEPPPSGQTA